MQQIQRWLIAFSACFALLAVSDTAQAQLPSFESAQAGCDDADARACMTLAHYHIKISEESQFTEGVAAYRAACKAGEAEGCFRVIMFAPYAKPKQDATPELERIAQGCTQNDAASCHYLGEIYQASGPDWVKRAPSVYEKSCIAGYGEACVALGLMYARGEKIEKDAAKAFKLYSVGCELKSAKACAIMGDKLKPNRRAEMAAAFAGVSYAKGDSVQSRKYYQQAAALYKTKCQRGDGLACNSLAAMYQHGEGVPASLKQAVIYWKKSCDLGEKGICVFYEANRAKVGL